MSVSYAPARLRIPQGFEHILEGLTREVLRDQPGDIIQFAADYFKKQLDIRNTTGVDPTQPTVSSAKLKEKVESQKTTVTTADTSQAVEVPVPPSQEQPQQPEKEEIDIDLKDPKVIEAAGKIQTTFKNFLSKKKGTEQPQEDLKQENQDQPPENQTQEDQPPENQTQEDQPPENKTQEDQPPEEVIDIDLKDPKVVAAAGKIETSFKSFLAKKKTTPQSEDDAKDDGEPPGPAIVPSATEMAEAVTKDEVAELRSDSPNVPDERAADTSEVKEGTPVIADDAEGEDASSRHDEEEQPLEVKGDDTVTGDKDTTATTEDKSDEQPSTEQEPVTTTGDKEAPTTDEGDQQESTAIDEKVVTVDDKKESVTEPLEPDTETQDESFASAVEDTVEPLPEDKDTEQEVTEPQVTEDTSIGEDDKKIDGETPSGETEEQQTKDGDERVSNNQIEPVEGDTTKIVEEQPAKQPVDGDKPADEGEQPVNGDQPPVDEGEQSADKGDQQVVTEGNEGTVEPASDSNKDDKEIAEESDAKTSDQKIDSEEAPAEDTTTQEEDTT